MGFRKPCRKRPESYFGVGKSVQDFDSPPGQKSASNPGAQVCVLSGPRWQLLLNKIGLMTSGILLWGDTKT